MNKILSPFAENRGRKSEDECEEISASEGFRSRRSTGRRYHEHKLAGASSILLALLLLAFVFAGVASAQTPPDFPACSNPQGTLDKNYTSGIHGVVGDPNTYSGADGVYGVDAVRTLQCFCSDAGNGIQTNWWRVGSLTQDEIDTLVKLGWNYVPDGSVWGLNSEAYMAKNSPYACGGSSSSQTRGAVLAAASTSTSGSVLGLASTGEALTFYGLIVLGFASILLGTLLKRKYAN